MQLKFPPSSVAHLMDEASRYLSPGSQTPKLDAEILLCFCLDRERTWLRTWPEQLVPEPLRDRFLSLVAQRANGVPVAYLTGEKEFWSRSFRVKPGVLVPRPDTETLIEQALLLIPVTTSFSVLDLGTGSGIIAITLAAERPNARIVAVDQSTQALEVARFNGQRHQSRNVELRLGHWFSPIHPEESFNLIVSNPPYLAEDDPHLGGDGIRHEPRSALVAGKAGLDDIEIIACEARSYLRPDGHLLLEHGHDQAPAVARLFSQQGYQDIRHHPDLSGHLRVTSGKAASAWTARDKMAQSFPPH